MDPQYLVKRVRVRGHSRLILLQDRNGPCPLLAIANALLLRGNLDALKVVGGRVSMEALCGALNEYLFRTHASLLQSDQEHALDVHKNLADVMALYPQLQHGMAVNVGFGDCNVYELTHETIAFDAFRVRLFHGWLVDPQEGDMWAALHRLKYNAALDLLVASASTPANATSCPATAAATGAAADEKSRESTPEADAPEPSNSDDFSGFGTGMGDPAARATYVRAFLDASPWQFTYRGLVRIHELLNEGEYAVLFRSNHFATITKHAGAVYVLVTDAGYIDEPYIVWEQLVEIGGDSVFVDGDFQPAICLASPGGEPGTEASAALPSATHPVRDEGGGRAAPGASATDDYWIARKIQEEEDARVAAALSANARSGAQRKPPPPHKRLPWIGTRGTPRTTSSAASKTASTSSHRRCGLQ
ncbi:hypothetical protein CDCA_CDCA03G0880 [Cyanidium caldarium]|uniref:MINDY deubiquitinase domain-containing protein n=1 Tax=Cyanidium caldarium TaxID=2771 RepID=A0AAV9IRX9_CYACA|nr:hypothetical protein CDCA_CDCA03G0880 [Cyanidium caldarium]